MTANTSMTEGTRQESWAEQERRVSAGIRQRREGLERLLAAVNDCHAEPDPECLNCRVSALEKAVAVIAWRHRNEAFAEWPDGGQGLRAIDEIIDWLGRP